MRRGTWAQIACLLLLGAALSTGSALAELSTVQLKARSFTPEGGLEALDGGGAGRHFLVQLTDPSARADLETRGVQLLQYIPQNTWIASFSREAMVDATVRTHLAWAGELLTTDKMPVRWQRGEYGEWARLTDGRLELRVHLHADAGLAATHTNLLALGVEPIHPFALSKGFTVVTDEALIPRIAALDEVLWMTEGLPEPEINNDGNRANTNAGVLQEAPYNLTGANVNVGIWDGGLVDPNHDDFEGRLTAGETGGVHDHSTHVAGTVGGSGVLSENHGGSHLQWRGMAPECLFFSWGFNGDIIGEILDGISDHDLDLETNSWNYGVSGGNCWLYGEYGYLAPEFDEIVRGAGGHTISVSFSASNERDDGDCPLLEGEYACIPPPATAKNVITVGATNSDDDTMTGFSSWGPVDDGRLKPDVTAPGCEHFGESGIRSTMPGDNYGLKCGTSMAAPTVTGNLALLYQLFRQEFAEERPLPAMMKGLLIGTGVDLGNPGPDYAFGHGRIDGQAAADALSNDTQIVLSVSQGDTHEYAFNVPAGTPELRFVLVWDDPPGSPSAEIALVNDLDLVLIDPSSGEHLPWVVDPESPSENATRAADHLNNVEHIQVDDPAPGLWRARVSGTHVPEGPQTAALFGLDLNAPGAPLGFAVASAGETSLDLTWTNAANVDRRGTLIARSEGPSLWFGPVDGTAYTVGDVVVSGVEVIYVADEDHSEDPYVDGGLTAGHTYFYAAYTFDDMYNYSVAAQTQGTTGDPAEVEASDVRATVFQLGPAQPNPTRAGMAFAFSLPSNGIVQIKVYDSSGRRVRTLLSAEMSAGSYSARWDGRDQAGRPVAPGIYFYELRTDGERLSRRVSLMR